MKYFISVLTIVDSSQHSPVLEEETGVLRLEAKPCTSVEEAAKII